MHAFSPRKVAVLGAGVMGTQIACDLGDKGYSVHLFDMPGLAEKQLTAAIGNDLCSSTGMRRVVPVDSTGENHPLLGEADWIVEAVFEEQSAKDGINAVIGAHRKPEGVVTTNTSGLGINAMARSQSADFCAGYALSHYFNPVKALGLLEVCPVEGTDPDLYDAFCHFASYTIGKTVVHVRDTPNFVGNRIGGFALFLPFRLDTAELSVLDIDRICLCTVGWEPLKTWDIVGLPLAGPLGGNVYDRALDDPRHEWWNPKVPEIETLVGQGLVGRKGRTRSGFLGMVEGRKTMFDFGKGEYVPARLSDFPSLTVAMSRETRSRQKMEALLSSEGDDPAARFARGFFYSTLAYGLRMVGEICDDITDIDTALKHGFNWPAGLFERAQQVGLETCLEGMEAAGCGDMVPDWYRGIVAGGGQLYDEPAGTFYSWTGNRMDSLPSVAGGIYPGMLRKSAENVLFANDDAAVLDISDDSGQVCLVEITARALGHGPIEAGHRALDWAEQQQAAVVFGSSGPHFGFGADLQLFHRWSEDGEAQTISNLIRAGQEFTQRVEYSSCPTVAAIQGMCLGGASELALACNRRVANGSLNIGQPELNVGVIPAWGGLMRLCRRMERGLLPSYLWGESMTVTVLVEHLMEVLRLYSRIVTSSDAYHAREVGFLNDHDIIVPAQGLGQPFVLKRAKEVAQSMLLAGFRPGPPFLFNLPGKEGFAEFKATAELGSMQDRAPVGHPEHNTKCATLAARVLCGGESNNLGTPVDEQTLLDLEHDGFMEVVMTEEARDYIRKIINR